MKTQILGRSPLALLFLALPALVAACSADATGVSPDGDGKGAMPAPVASATAGSAPSSSAAPSTSTPTPAPTTPPTGTAPQPSASAGPPGPPPNATPFAALSHATPHEIVVDDDNLYVLAGDQMIELGKTDGTTRLVGQPGPMLHGLAQNAALVFFGDDTGGLWSFSKANGTLLQLGQDASPIVDVSVNADTLFYATSGDHVGAVDLDGGPIRTSPIGSVVVPGHVSHVAASMAGGFFAVSSPSIANGYIAKWGAGSVPSVGQPSALALGGRGIYWTDATTGDLYVSDLDGSNELALADGWGSEDHTTSIVVDGDNVYWADADAGAIRHLLSGGGGSFAAASGQDHPWGLAMDQQALYWTNTGTGFVMVMARPE